MKLLAGIADTSKDGLISFAEFQAFEGLLCTPDALYKTAFQLFDTQGNGTVAYGKYLSLSWVLLVLRFPVTILLAQIIKETLEMIKKHTKSKKNLKSNNNNYLQLI